MEVNFQNLLGYSTVIQDVSLDFISSHLYSPRFWQMVLPFNSIIERISNNRFFIRMMADEIIEAEITLIDHGYQRNGSYLIEIYMKPNEKVERFDARIRLKQINKSSLKVGFFIQDFIPRSIIFLRKRFRLMLNLRKSIREALNNLNKFIPI